MPTSLLQRLAVTAAATISSLSIILAGCEEAEAPLFAMQPALEDPLVPVYRQATPETVEQRRAALTGDDGPAAASLDAGQDFYLAIRKSELGQKWFLSAFLSQQAPDGVASGAARSLGTRVVSLKVQNRKLFVFDVADDKIWSDTFRPEVVLEAYPIIQGYSRFDKLRGSDEYVLFDPAAGLNRFRMLQESWGPIEIALSFSQRFRRIEDGATFEQVFSGVLTTPLPVAASITGTLSLALRRYSEGEGYVATPMPRVEHYFRSPPRLVPNQGTRAFVAAKWNIHEGGQPIVWKIAPLTEKLRDDPEWRDIDFQDAIKAGIESWNEAFGFEVMQAEPAGPDESHGDDDVNYFIFDASRSFGGAFANWRSNPNNGEVRGASVYFALGLLGSLGELRPPGAAQVIPDSTEPAVVEPPTGAAIGPRFAWGEAAEEALCDLALPALEDVLDSSSAATLAFSRKERIERFLGHVAAHEVGHTLGLRHNFKGSLLPPSSSVMEYVAIEDAVAMGPHVGSYDIAAIRHLYRLSPELPSEPFCNDGQADVVDPDCRRFDLGSSPLTDYWIPNYRRELENFLTGRRNSILSPVGLVPHLRLATTAAVRVQAYEGIIGLMRAPVTPPAGAPADFAARLNAVTQLALRAMFLNPLPGQVAPAGQPVPLPPPPAAAVIAAATTDLQAVLVNADGLRAAATRRLAVDVLKRFQSRVAFTALAEARDRIAAQLPSQAGGDAVDAKDLLNRIDRTLAAYFD